MKKLIPSAKTALSFIAVILIVFIATGSTVLSAWPGMEAKAVFYVQ